MNYTITLIISILIILLSAVGIWTGFFEDIGRGAYNLNSYINSSDSGSDGGIVEETVQYDDPEDSVLAVDEIVTAYCLTGTMASGLEVYDGAIACPRYIPLKSRVEINGITYICEDRMNLRFPDRYDIWMSDCDDCMEFGKRTLNIKIYNNL